MAAELKSGTYEQVATADLIPYARNSRKHSPEQIDQIAASLREFGFLAPVVIAPDNTILAGHGRILAAQKLGLEYVPAVRAEHLTEAQRRAYVIVDNRLSETSEWDTKMLTIELHDLSINFPNIDMEAMGFSDDELSELNIDLSFGDGGEGGEGSDSQNDENIYSTKIESPVYIPTGPKPPIAELYDLETAEKLIAEIDASALPEDEKRFLRFAAYRHVVFDYRNIAEYYAHSSAKTQEIMENSALVIIDFNKAIEKGFVQMTKDLAEAYKNEEG